jgi:hypothetical protein
MRYCVPVLRRSRPSRLQPFTVSDRLHERSLIVPWPFLTVWNLLLTIKGQERWTTRDVGRSETFLKSCSQQFFRLRNLDVFHYSFQSVTAFRTVKRYNCSTFLTVWDLLKTRKDQKSAETVQERSRTIQNIRERSGTVKGLIVSYRSTPFENRSLKLQPIRDRLGTFVNRHKR